jgi:HEAT repeat protein
LAARESRTRHTARIAVHRVATAMRRIDMPGTSTTVCVRRALILLAASASLAAGQSRRSLDSTAVSDIARLLLLEDVRRFDSLELGRALESKHPEVRRRAMLAVAHIFDKRGVALLRAQPLDADTALAATAVFAVGQLRDTATIPWLDSLLSNPRTAPTVATEAACALGKIKTAGAREVLARYLMKVTAGPRTHATIGEALLSIGRSTARGDIAPIVKWTSSPDEEIRWRATWALFRPREPGALAHLLRLSDDRSAHVGRGRCAVSSSRRRIPRRLASAPRQSCWPRCVTAIAAFARKRFAHSAPIPILSPSRRSSTPFRRRTAGSR